MNENKKTSGIRLLLIDDHECMLLGLSRLLAEAAEMRVVGIASCLLDAETELLKKKPDVVVLDIQLKGDESGFSFIPRAKALVPGIKIVIFSTFASEAHRRLGQLLGVDGYVAKGENMSVLVTTIRKSVFPQARHDEMTCKTIGIRKGLSQSEERIFSGLSQGMSQKEVAATIGVSPSTVATHVQRAKEKLGAKSVAQLLALFGQLREIG